MTASGSVFGNQDKFTGLGIFFDTYSNHPTHSHEHPYISALVNDGPTDELFKTKKIIHSSCLYRVFSSHRHLSGSYGHGFSSPTLISITSLSPIHTQDRSSMITTLMAHTKNLMAASPISVTSSLGHSCVSSTGAMSHLILIPRDFIVMSTTSYVY